ncbi:39S ribosomal protein L20, mitochondrial [Rhagoletis pomonella]|uniref:39S ribosomal protein L20, mitochondrial n=1 Tax=Rhagoletis pomonella TaxID=28610 RepID=UPI001782A22A|nr:39S ribosomal protein L20, mitochondrial [Rhagoletis pomonella]
MVSQTLALFVRSRGPDEFWRKRRIFKLAAHFRGRKRNCYSIAVRNVHRALVYATKGRKLKKLDMAELWSKRVEAGCEQYGITLETFKETLARNNILLNKKALADLAIWEPRSFEALVKLSRERAVVESLPGLNERSVMNQVYGLANLKLDK